MFKYAVIVAVIASLLAYIGWEKYRQADQVCDTRIERINNEAETQVTEANKAADVVQPSDDLVALCLRDKYCRSR